MDAALVEPVLVSLEEQIHALRPATKDQST
jgi:hypothetical protein